MLTIIYGHPWPGSFNHSILETVLSTLTKQNVPYGLVDLYADCFDPAVRKEDLALYGSGGTADTLARKYMEILTNTDKLIFIYPVWWGLEPAIVKGFYDKVLLKDFAWKYSADGQLLPLLNIEKALIFTTSDAPTHIFAAYFQEYLPAHVFAAVGIKNSQWHNFDNIPRRTRKECGAFLQYASKKVAELIY